MARARWVREEGFQAAWQSEDDRRRLETEEELVREARGCLEGYRRDCLYRYRVEYGLVGLLDMMLEQVSLAAARMLENLTEKLELQSRARKTYRAMLDMAQRVGSSHRKLWPSYPGQAAGGQGQPGRPLEGGARRQDQVAAPGQRTLGQM